MHVSDWHAARQRDVAEILAVARRVALDAPVPSCPGWALRDLVGHVGEVLFFWSSIVRDELQGPEDLPMPARPPDDELADWVEAQALEADRVFLSSAADDPCWSWSHRPDVGFVIRRTAHELAVHRWDAESAAGGSNPIDGALASDGIDEFLDHFASWPQPDKGTLAGTVHLHCTDVPGEWLVVQEGDHLGFTREHAKGACAIRGSASDLLLVLWRRLPLGAAEVIGDAAVAAQFVGWTELN